MRDEVDPAGHFLGDAHTMRKGTTALYEPTLSDSENVESRGEAGQKDMRQRAYEGRAGMLERHEVPKIDESKIDMLKRVCLASQIQNT